MLNFRSSLSKARIGSLAILLAIVALCAFVLWTTRAAMTHLPFLNNSANGTEGKARNQTLVDQTPWLTVQALAPLAVTAEEERYVRAAERLADHEVDQAFNFALRKADMEQRQLSGPALLMAQKVTQLQKVVAQDQARVDQLSHPGGNSGAAKISDALDVWKAQLGLDTDILHETETALARASGDPRAEIERQLKAREATLKDYDKQAQQPFDPASIAVRLHHTLASRVETWFAQSSRQKAIQLARSRALQDAATLSAEYARLQAESQEKDRKADTHSLNASSSDATDALASLRQRAAVRELLGILDDRIQTEKRLAETYREWGDQVELQHGILLHLIAESSLWLAMILIFTLIADTAVRHWTNLSKMDQRRLHTLRAISEVAIQLVGIVLMLLVIFGVPDHLTTILGLATAGITVALQDFLLAFLGWFVLIGKGGIRIGDHVQIDGATGEVIEIRLFRTTLLETGNSPDSTHPTGRRVTMLNSYAITGQYYSFSTANQWMWDELSVSLPRSASTWELAERIHQVVREATDADAQLAEKEWRHTFGPLAQEHAKAAAEIHLRPSDGGISLRVHYVTRASTRYEARNRLYQQILEALGTPATPQA